VALTARRVETEKRPGMHADSGNLYLRIGGSGAKSWVFRYSLGGRRRDMGIGACALVTLTEARDIAIDLRRSVRQGIDPIEQRRHDRAAAAVKQVKGVTFSEAATRYVEAHRAAWTNAKHQYQWDQTLGSYINPLIGELDVSKIDTAAVLKVLQPIWITKAETATRVRGRIERILDYAVSSGLREGENPARWKGHLDNLLPKRSKVARVVHYAALPYRQMAEFMVDLKARESVAARALEFAILTCGRTGEVLGAKWTEFDLEQRIWTVPADRMKAGREHRVPLSRAALVIMEAMGEIRSGEFVFPGQIEGRPLSNMALLMQLRRIDRADLTVHGFRSTFRDWVSEATNFPSEAAELALAHVIANAVEAAYRRGDQFEKRRQLAEAWAAYCGTGTPGEVVTLRRDT
jgi:integrase